MQGPGGRVTFTYDGDGLRFSKTTVTGTTYYVRNPQGEVTEEWSGTPSLLAEYVYLDRQRVCKVAHDAQNVEHRIYYHADMVGTPVAETNESGQLLVRSQYYPFGDEVKPGTAADPHKFTGKELDDEFGLYYFGARYYDAHLGRFVSVDPGDGWKDNPQSWNRYAYGLNNPTRYVDPNGDTAVAASAVFLAGPADLAATPALVAAGSLVGGWVLGRQLGSVSVGGQTIDDTVTDALEWLLTRSAGDAESRIAPPLMSEHTKGERPSTREKHEAGRARSAQDRGGEKGDARRRPSRRRPEGHKGPWPPKAPEAPSPKPSDSQAGNSVPIPGTDAPTKQQEPGHPAGS